MWSVEIDTHTMWICTIHFACIWVCLHPYGTNFVTWSSSTYSNSATKPVLSWFAMRRKQKNISEINEIKKKKNYWVAKSTGFRFTIEEWVHTRHEDFEAKKLHNGNSTWIQFKRHQWWWLIIMYQGLQVIESLKNWSVNLSPEYKQYEEQYYQFGQ